MIGVASDRLRRILYAASPEGSLLYHVTLAGSMDMIRKGGFDCLPCPRAGGGTLQGISFGSQMWAADTLFRLARRESDLMGVIVMNASDAALMDPHVDMRALPRAPEVMILPGLRCHYRDRDWKRALEETGSVVLGRPDTSRMMFHPFHAFMRREEAEDFARAARVFEHGGCDDLPSP